MRVTTICLILISTPALATPPCGSVKSPVEDTGHALVKISEAPPLSLESALASLGESPEALAAVAKMGADLSARLGMAVSEEELRERLNDPRSVQELFSITPAQLAQAFATAQVISDANGGNDNSNAFKLPRTVDLEKAPTYFQAPRWEPEVLYGPLVRYALPSGISDQEAVTRTAFGEILDRLALNWSAKSKQETFELRYQGKPYTDYIQFIDALRQQGHSIEVDVSNEVADFVHLMIKQEDGSLREIQTDVRMRTGLQPREAPEIIVPAIHSHFIIRIAGPHVNTAVEFYQGTGGTRFYPSVIVRGESWVGIRNSETYTGEKALETTLFSGVYMDVLQGIAAENELFAGGYTQTGVCNDSVVAIQKCVDPTRDGTAYPLLIDKTIVLPYLERMIKERPALASYYRRLHAAVSGMASDRTVDATAPDRILRSIPYPEGETPYPGFNDARRIFRGQ